MNLTRIVLLLSIINNRFYSQQIEFQKIEIDTNYSFRGLSVVNDKVAWVSGRYGIIGKSVDGGKQWKFIPVQGSEKMDFRSVYAFNANNAIIANAGSPAYIMRTSDGGLNWKIVYTNKDSSAFFDGVDFWNDREGIIYGDPIKGRMLLLKTDDGGQTWTELPEESRPVLAKGEASFAASGTGIRCYGKDKVMITTGGKVSRLLVSKNKGKNWSAFLPPIIQGKESTGIFSLAFQNDFNGIIVGGDFDKNAVPQNHVFYTKDGGITWKAPGKATGGYRSSVEFIGKDLAIAAGPGGADISFDWGASWDPLENGKNFNVVRKARKGKLVIAAGHKKMSVVVIGP